MGHWRRETAWAPLESGREGKGEEPAQEGEVGGGDGGGERKEKKPLPCPVRCPACRVGIGIGIGIGIKIGIGIGIGRSRVLSCPGFLVRLVVMPRLPTATDKTLVSCWPLSSLPCALPPANTETPRRSLP